MIWLEIKAGRNLSFHYCSHFVWHKIYVFFIRSVGWGNWNHVTGLCKRASKCLIVLLRLSGKGGGSKERLVLLDAFLCSIFTYCPTTWHFCSKKVEKMMEKIYERGLRFVMNDPSRSYEELLMLTKCDTMFLWRLKKIAFFIYKCFTDFTQNILMICLMWKRCHIQWEMT